MRRKNLWSALAFMALGALSMGMASCGDDNDNIVPPVVDEGKGGEIVRTDTVLNNLSKIFVTGGLAEATLGYSEWVSWSYSEYSGESLSGFYADQYEVTLYGYANLPSEMKILLGNGVSVGIEVADNAGFNDARRVYAMSLDTDNKFTVKTWAQAGRTLYWRAVMLTGDMRQYEETRSQQMPSLAEAIKNIPLELGEPWSIGNNEFYVYPKTPPTPSEWLKSRSVGLAYSTDQGKLSAANLRTLLDEAEWTAVRDDDSGWIRTGLYRYVYLLASTDDVNFLRPLSDFRVGTFHVVGLQPGTTYYYCLYVRAQDGSVSYVATSDIQSVKTEGLSLDEVKRYVNVSITPDDANSQWIVNYTSSLERNFPQEDFSYEIVTGPYTAANHMGIYCRETQMETGSSYNGVIPYCLVYGQVPFDTDDAEEGIFAGSSVLNNLYEKILNSVATDDERKEFQTYINRFGYVAVAPTAIQVRVKTGGVTYPVATKYRSSETKAQHISVADFLSRADTETTYELTGTVRNIVSTTYGNFDLVEDGSTIYIYGLLDFDGNSKNFASMGITEGTRVTLRGKYYLYNGKPEIKNAQIVQIG